MAKDVQNLYTENYRTLVRETKDLIDGAIHYVHALEEPIVRY